MKNSILVIDDESAIRKSLNLLLKTSYEVTTAETGEGAIQLMKEKPIDVVLLDIRLPGISGLAVLNEIKRYWPQTEVIMLTAQADSKTAVDATRLGAYDFIAKPFDNDHLKVSCKRALEKKSLVLESKQLKEESQKHISELIGQSEAMKKVETMIKKVAKTDSAVLITGETGTGKELVARAIHQNSERRLQPFVAINCGGIPSELLESELFGHEQGAFTSAVNDKPGKFELANGGTIFLDEIGNMPYLMQAKILRVLQEQEIERIGANRKMKINVRIISATHIDFKKEISQGHFREDLFHRLNVIPLPIPSLRQRGGDIKLLAHCFLERLRKKYGHHFKKISRHAMEVLENYRWPGNVRELEHLMERIVALEEGKVIHKEHLPVDLLVGNFDGNAREMNKNFNLKIACQDFEKEMILKAFRRSGGNQSKTSKMLGLNRTTLIAKLNFHDINLPENEY